MKLSECIPLLERYSRALVRWHADEDFRDLVQDTLVRLAQQPEEKLTEPYVVTACKNTWRNKLTRKALNWTYPLPHDEHPALAMMASVEVEIYSREIGRNLDDWPTPKKMNPEWNAAVEALTRSRLDAEKATEALRRKTEKVREAEIELERLRMEAVL